MDILWYLAKWIDIVAIFNYNVVNCGYIYKNKFVLIFKISVVAFYCNCDILQNINDSFYNTSLFYIILLF